MAVVTTNRPGRIAKALVAAASAALVIAGCQTSNSGNSASPSTATALMNCASPDYVNTVTAEGICFGIRTFVSGEQSVSPVLVVLLHGDVSSGGPADYMYGPAEDISQAHPGAVVVHMLRPGYDDGQGRQSSGSTLGRSDNYTAQYVDAIAGAIDALAAHYGAARTVLVGHSGGSAIFGSILGRHPSVGDAALLLSCPCDVDRWRADRNRSAWPSSLSPSDYAADVATSTQVVAMTGGGDTRTGPYLARDYVSALQARGVDAEFIEIPGATHGFSSLWGSRVQATLDRLMGG